MDGKALKFLEVLPESLSWIERLDRLSERAKPSKSSAFRALLACRRKANESIAEFRLRYRSMVEDYSNEGFQSTELRQIFVDNLDKNGDQQL